MNTQLCLHERSLEMAKEFVLFCSVTTPLMEQLLKDLESAIAAERSKEQITQPIEGYTGNAQADAALVMLDRLDVSEDDDVRIDAISKIIRELVQAKPQQEPVSEEREFWLGVCQTLDAKNSPTHNMTLRQRIAHVGGYETETNHVVFGSSMAVKALIDQVLRDTSPQPLKPLSDEHPLKVFARECALGCYTYDELRERAKAALNARTIEAKLGVGK